MVVLEKEMIWCFRNRPDLMSKWMISLCEMREVLIIFFMTNNIHGWQGLRNAMREFEMKFDVRELIIFYSRYELNERLLNDLNELSMKITEKRLEL